MEQVNFREHVWAETYEDALEVYADMIGDERSWYKPEMDLVHTEERPKTFILAKPKHHQRYYRRSELLPDVPFRELNGYDNDEDESDELLERPDYKPCGTFFRLLKVGDDPYREVRIY